MEKEEFNYFDPTQDVPEGFDTDEMWDFEFWWAVEDPPKKVKVVGVVVDKDDDETKVNGQTPKELFEDAGDEESKEGEWGGGEEGEGESDSNELILDLTEKDEPPEDTNTGMEFSLWDEDSIDIQDHTKKFVFKNAAGRVQQVFPTGRDFMEYVMGPVLPHMKGQRLMYTRPGVTDSSMGVKSLSEAKELSVLGWPEGAEAVKKLSEKLHSVLVGLIPVQQPVMQDEGQQIDVAKFLEGDPDHWIVMQDTAVNEEKRKPVMVRIVTTVDITWTPEAFMRRGAAILAVTQLLEQHGYRVQVDSHIGSNNVVDTWVRVKNFEDSVNIEKMAFWTAHPVMFWRLAYAAWVREADVVSRAGGLGINSMGYISEPAQDDRGDVYVSARQSSWCAREESTLEWVKDCLKTQGIEVGE